MYNNLDEWVKEFSYPVLKQKYDEEITRATGRSTRLADNYIQELFNNQNTWITITDHFGDKRSASILSNRIVKRLKFEHGDSIDIKEQLSPNGYPTLKLSYIKKRNDDIIEAMKRELDRRDIISNQSDYDIISNTVDTWVDNNIDTTKVVEDISGNPIRWPGIGKLTVNSDDICIATIAKDNCVSSTYDRAVDVIDKMENEINELKDKLSNQNKFVLEEQREPNIEFNIF